MPRAHLLKAIPWPIPMMTRPAMKTPKVFSGANVCMKVAIMVRKAPVAIPTRRPKRSACNSGLAKCEIVCGLIIAHNWATEKETSNNSTDGICGVTRTEELGVLTRLSADFSHNTVHMRSKHTSTGLSNQLSQFLEPWTEL
jgi:hypothetical protein